MNRLVTLNLLDNTGAPLGALPSFTIDRPYWQEVGDVIESARANFGVELSVLRLLSTEPSSRVGGAVSYLAQVDEQSEPPVHLLQHDVNLNPHPNRTPYAEVGGPAKSVKWAHASSPEHLVSASQQRTWNLSAIWALKTQSRTLWLKEVPKFLAHESVVLDWLNESNRATVATHLLATDGRRMLLSHVPGIDLYDADVTIRNAIATHLHSVQLDAIAAAGDLVNLGIPDRRSDQLVSFIKTLIETANCKPRLAEFVDNLRSALDETYECGLPDTLVHGDLHPGNARGNVDKQVLIDWGDSFVGHPAFDILRLTEDLDAADANTLIDAWAARWLAVLPNSDPKRAVSLLRPVAALRHAATYAEFLTKIEPTERVYHEADVPYWLNRASELIG